MESCTMQLHYATALCTCADMQCRMHLRRCSHAKPGTERAEQKSRPFLFFILISDGGIETYFENRTIRGKAVAHVVCRPSSFVLLTA